MGRISKRGESAMRKLLYEAANILFQCVPRFSRLKAWAMKLADKKELTKTTVVAARKTAVILTRILRCGTAVACTSGELSA